MSVPLNRRNKRPQPGHQCAAQDYRQVRSSQPLDTTTVTAPLSCSGHNSGSAYSRICGCRCFGEAAQDHPKDARANGDRCEHFLCER